MLNLLQDQIKNILALASLSFFIALLWTPILTNILYKFKCWKKGKNERKVPRMGGILVWLTVLILTLLFDLQVWLPLGVLVLGALVGLVDDIRCLRSSSGLRFTWRMIIVLLIGLLSGFILFNFYNFPSYYIALVPILMIIIFGGAPLDGLDGIFAGSVIPMFGGYAIIAFYNNQMELASFSALIVGALLTFLYFNIPPARFFMGETGVIGLLTVLPILAILTDTLIYLPIIAAPLIVTAFSILLQIFTFQVFKKRIFIKSPLHHHFEGLGWPHYKITMRYWVFSGAFALLGTAMAVI